MRLAQIASVGVILRAPCAWSELMRRVFGLDVLRCEVCKARRRLVSLITKRDVIVRILSHLGLETDPPAIQPARAPPQLELGV